MEQYNKKTHITKTETKSENGQHINYLEHCFHLTTLCLCPVVECLIREEEGGRGGERGGGEEGGRGGERGGGEEGGERRGKRRGETNGSSSISS